nr:iron-sulfur cluster carrier protein ApbC [Teredinibacter waterburyi]
MSDSLINDLLALPVPGVDGMVLGEIAEVKLAAQGYRIDIRLGVHFDSTKTALEAAITEFLQARGTTCELHWQCEVLAAKSLQSQKMNAISGVKNIIAVASGKGGVGKSTTAANIALALVHAGARVGVLDADIYGPSQPQMLGVGGQRPELAGGGRILPVSALGLQLISMGNMVTDSTPMVWRGPMVSGALQQLLNNTNWDNLDYLVIDMPPGTGDIQLTLSQAVPVSGSVIVTTPQDIALLDAKKGIEMFRKVDIPVMGVVENMSTHTCSNCGHTEAIFGDEGGARLAAEYQVPVLGKLPLAMDIRALTDAGKPPVAADPDSAISLEYRNIAHKVALLLWQQAVQGDAGPEIVFSND